MTSVFVSGANGFIGQHIVLELLKNGYKVVGTVRSKEKGDHLSKLFNSDAFSYEVVPDIGTKGAFDDALKKHPEVSVFLHNASPLRLNVKDIEQELIWPAINGTQNALQAIKEHGPQIKKVVVTSSYAAMGDFSRMDDPSYVSTEESWNPITWEEAKKNNLNGYLGSKKFAEKAAWDFVAREKPSYKINYVNPVHVFGPQAFDSEVKDHLNTSSEVLKSYMELTPQSDVPVIKDLFVDVRDVARAHLIAFEKDLSNERLFVASGYFTGQGIVDILNSRLLKGKLPIGDPSAGTRLIEQGNKYDNSRTRKILGFEMIGLKQTVEDAISQILNARQK